MLRREKGASAIGVALGQNNCGSQGTRHTCELTVIQNVKKGVPNKFRGSGTRKSGLALPLVYKLQDNSFPREKHVSLSIIEIINSRTRKCKHHEHCVTHRKRVSRKWRVMSRRRLRTRKYACNAHCTLVASEKLLLFRFLRFLLVSVRSTRICIHTRARVCFFLGAE